MAKAESPEELMQRGFDCIDRGEHDDALAIGKKLKRLRHSSAFEILALAYAGQEQLEKAVAVLEEGVALVPDVWLLWQLLGNLRSDLQRYPRAHEAYQRALQCKGVNGASVALNTSIALEREGELAAALAVLDDVSTDDIEIGLRLAARRVSLLSQNGRPEEAIQVAEETLSQNRDHDEYPEQTAKLHAHLGEALWRGRRDKEAALAQAWKAIALDKCDRSALWLLRELQQRVSPSARYFRILVCGEWPWDEAEDGGPLSFFTTYDVVADTPDEALTFLKACEPFEVRDSLGVEECHDVEPRPNEPKGVYRATGYSLFPRSDSA